MKVLDVVISSNSEKLRALNDMNIGTQARQAIAKIDRSADQKKHLLMKFRDYFIRNGKYMQSHLPLDSRLLKNLRCLQYIPYYGRNPR